MALIWIYRIIRWTLAGVFIWAGAVKLMAPKDFAKVIASYNLAPDYMLAPLAIGLPMLEIIAGIGLIFDIAFTLETVTGLLGLFIVVLWFGILKGLDIDCGCFSPNELKHHDELRRALYRDIVFMAMAVYLFVHRWIYRKSTGPAITGSR